MKALATGFTYGFCAAFVTGVTDALEYGAGLCLTQAQAGNVS